MARRGLRVADLLDKQLLKNTSTTPARKRTPSHALFNGEAIDPDEMYEEYAAIA